MPRVRLWFAVEYDIDPDTMLDNYGTTDPIEAAEIDRKTAEQYPEAFLDGEDEIRVRALVIGT